MEQEELIHKLESRKIKPTANRILVLRTLRHASHPMSIADLEDDLVTMDKSSIFRALTLFLEHDLVHSIEDGSGSLKYEVCLGEHERILQSDILHRQCACSHC